MNDCQPKEKGKKIHVSVNLLQMKLRLDDTIRTERSVVFVCAMLVFYFQNN